MTADTPRDRLAEAWKELVAEALRRNVVVAVGKHRELVEAAVVAALTAERDALRTARLVAQHWLGALLAWPDVPVTATHALNMVIAAMDGEQDPRRLGINEDQYDAFRAALVAPTPDQERGA